MMLRFALLSASLFAGACAATPPVDPHVATPAAVSATCGLKVNFASIGTGIDSETLQKVDALLSGDTGVSTIDRQRWGKEGEITLCIDTKTTADTGRLFGAITRLFPATSVKPISVETAAGQQFRVPTP